MQSLRAPFRRSLLLALLWGGAGLLAARDEASAIGAELIHLPSMTVEGVREPWERVPITDDEDSPAAAASLTAALPASPGLILQESGDGFYPPRITVRGSGLQSAPTSRGLLLRLDSLPLNAADGSFNLALLEPGFFGTFSFQPGALDSVAAVQALGGALDLFWWRKTGDVSGAASVSVGNDGLVRALVRDGAGADTPSPWQTALAVTRSEGWRPNSEQERLAAAVQAKWPGRGGPTQSLTVYAVRAALRIPGPLTLAAAESEPDTISAGAAASLPRRTTDYARLVYRATWDDGPTVAFGVQAAEDDFRQLRANGIVVTRGADFSALLADAWTVGPVQVAAGLTGVAGSRTQERFANGGGARGAQFADLDLQASTLTGWLDARWKPARNVSLKAGCSVVAARREASGTATATGTMRADQLAPHCEIVVSPPSEYGRRLVEGFVRAERGVEAPTFDDLLAVRGTAPNLALGWTPLRAQTADTLSVGVRGSFGDRLCQPERLWFDVKAYIADWREELLRLADADSSPRGTVNAGPTRHRGIESQLRWRIYRGSPFVGGTPPVDLLLGHTWSEARFARDPVYGTSRLAGLPPHVGIAQLSWGQKGGLAVRLGARWSWGTTYVDHANKLGYSGHTLAHAGLSWLDDHWTLSLEVNNLLNRRYIASTAGVLDLARTPATTALFLPGNPRSVTATLEWRW